MDKNRVVKFLLKSDFINWIYENNKIISRVLIISLCIGVCYSLYLFFTMEGRIQKEVKNIRVYESRNTKKIKFPKLSSKSYYKAPLRKKNIFKGEVKDKEVEPKKDISYEFVKRLQLKGIMSGMAPKAIIEDPSKSKTWWVGVGEEIKGVEVREINSGKVKLYYKGKYFTLNL